MFIGMTLCLLFAVLFALANKFPTVSTVATINFALFTGGMPSYILVNLIHKGARGIYGALDFEYRV